MAEAYTARVKYRFAQSVDLPRLAELNAQLICDEGHANPMNLAQLEARMASWLEGAYRAVVFEEADQIVAYALFRNADDGWESGRQGVYLRQFFVVRERRRRGLGREALALLRHELWGTNCRITLETLIHNHPARAFWRSLQFREYCVSYQLYEPAAESE